MDEILPLAGLLIMPSGFREFKRVPMPSHQEARQTCNGQTAVKPEIKPENRLLEMTSNPRQAVKKPVSLRYNLG